MKYSPPLSSATTVPDAGATHALTHQSSEDSSDPADCPGVGVAGGLDFYSLKSLPSVRVIQNNSCWALIKAQLYTCSEFNLKA